MWNCDFVLSGTWCLNWLQINLELVVVKLPPVPPTSACGLEYKN